LKRWWQPSHWTSAKFPAFGGMVWNLWGKMFLRQYS
jgi:hypothetical protein